MGLFRKDKCQYCGRTDLYIRKAFPIPVYGCKDCDKKISGLLKERGMSKEKIKKIIQERRA